MSEGSKDLDLGGRIALVIGGSSGLGRAVALALAAAGATVVPTGRRRDAAEATASEIAAAGGTARFVTSCDVCDRRTLESLRDRLDGAGLTPDILVNAAGRTAKAPTLEVEEDQWSAILDTNLSGTWRACQVFAPAMIDAGWGRIVNIASLASFVGLHQVAAYTASKAGVAGLTRALAVEWGRHGVRVNAIAPGVFPTDLNRSLLEGTERGREFLTRTPLARFGEPAEIGGAAVLLASEAASFINGEILTVDGGFLASGVNA